MACYLKCGFPKKESTFKVFYVWSNPSIIIQSKLHHNRTPKSRPQEEIIFAGQLSNYQQIVRFLLDFAFIVLLVFSVFGCLSIINNLEL